MIHVQYLISTKNRDNFWIKPFWCPIGRPFCIVRWNTKQGLNVCPFYSGVRRETDKAMYVWCKYDEVSKSNIPNNIPENCLICTYYRCPVTLGDICMLYREFRDPCSNFMDEEKSIVLRQTKSLFKKEEDS